eukprot:617050_1
MVGIETNGGTSIIQSANISNNDVTDHIIRSKLNGGDFVLESVDIIGNHHLDDSIVTLIDASVVSSVSMHGVVVRNNYALTYLALYGHWSSDITMNNVNIIDNDNPNQDLADPRLAIDIRSFHNMVLKDTVIANNDRFDILLNALLDQNVDIISSDVVNNNGESHLVNISGIASLRINDANISNNNVNTLLECDGTNLGNVDINRMEFTRNNHNHPSSQTLVYLDGFIDISLNHSRITNNQHVTNMFVLSLFGGDMLMDNTLFIDNNADDTLLNVTGIEGKLQISDTTFDSNTVSDMLVFDGMESADIAIDGLTIQNNNLIQPGTSIISLHHFQDVQIDHAIMRNNDVQKYLIYGVLLGDATLRNMQFAHNQVDFEIMRIFGGEEMDNSSSSSISFTNLTITHTTKSSTNTITQSLLSMDGFGSTNFATVNFSHNSAANLLVFQLTGTQIDFEDAIFSDNVLQYRLLDFSGQGVISLSDSHFKQNNANTLISCIGVDYDVNSLLLQLDTLSFIDNNIQQSVFELGDVSAELLGMTLSENKLFINILSVVDIQIKQSQIKDMSGIYMNATIPSDSFNLHSKINISSSNFTATPPLSDAYFGITSFMNPNDEIYVSQSVFTLLPIRIFSNDLSPNATLNQNKNTVLLFEECTFSELNNQTAFTFETLGRYWYPNITFDSCLFSDTKLNIIETEVIHQSLFYSSIILKQCSFEDVSGTAVFHSFIVAPIIHISFQSGVWQNYTLSTPFLIAELSNPTDFPCRSLPEFITHSLVDTTFINNKIAGGMFQVECASIQFRNSMFIRNHELSGTKVGLMDVGGGNHVSIDNCSFDSNVFNFVGLIYDYGYPIDASLHPLVSITDSIFRHNMAPKGSVISVLYNNASMAYSGPSYLIANSIFDSNIATDSGGIIYIDINHSLYDRQLEIDGCNITNNIASNHGGAIYSKDFTVSIYGSRLGNNTANASGGSIALMSDTCDQSTSHLYIEDSLIHTSKARIGGAISIGCTELYMNGSYNQITNNEATSRGGAIRTHHSCISSSVDTEILFESNVAGYGGDISFTGGVSDGNSCVSEWRANTMFHNSQAYRHGGSVHVMYAPLTDNALFLPDYVIPHQPEWHNTTTYLIMDHAQFVDTQGSDYGSAITVEYADYKTDNIDSDTDGLPLSITIENALFDTNAINGSISYGGNAITFLAHHSHVFQQLIVYNSTFTNNDYSDSTQSLYGGHIWIDLNICIHDLGSADSDYAPDDCECIERFNNSYEIDFKLSQSRFSDSNAVYGGAVYSKLPITINSMFTDTSATHGGGIYVGCAKSIHLNQSYFQSTESLTHGGAVLVQNVSNVFIASTVFHSCHAQYAGGALAYIMHSDYDSNIQITSSTQFINNSAVMGGALFSSQHKLGIITEPTRIVIDQNVTTDVDVNLDTIDVDQGFDTQYIFVLLEPTLETLQSLQWHQDFVWNDTAIVLSNDISTTQLTFSTVDDTRFISPLFIPLTTTSRDKAWEVSESISWNLKLNFGPFWESLLDNANITQLQFDIVLLSYPILLGTTQQNIAGKSLVLQLEDGVSFERNFASALGAAIYVNDDLFSYFKVIMNGVGFTANEASGLTGFAINSYVLDDNADTNKQIQANDVQFTENIAYTSSACLSVIATNLTCDECVFLRNSVATFGAALYVKDGEIHLSNSKIIQNDSPLGGNLMSFKSILSISGTAFNANQAMRGHGAAISIYNLNELLLEQMESSANALGIITELSVHDLVSISYCTFTNHVSKEDGAAVYVYLKDAWDDDDVARRRLQNMQISDDHVFKNRRLLQSNFSTTGSPTLEPTGSPTLEPTTFPTWQPTPDPSHPTSDPTVNANCVRITILPDHHMEDITWILSYGSHSMVSGNATFRNDECIHVTDDTDCITFSIEDAGHDGLNYGQGSYAVTWGHNTWQSISAGNYFNTESMTLCDATVLPTTHLDIYVSIEDELSYVFLQFLDDIINPLMDYTLLYDIRFVDIHRENEMSCDDYDCMAGFCACNVDGHNNTLSDIAMALCYSSNATMSVLYSDVIEWQHFWDDDVDETTMQSILNQCDVAFELSTNYHAIQNLNFVVPSFTNTRIEPISNESYTTVYDYQSKINDLLSADDMNTSSCSLYAMFLDIMDTICNIDDDDSVPYLCQATPDHCSLNSCSATDSKTWLFYQSDSKSGIVDFEPYTFVDTVGSTLLNIPFLPSKLYGIDEYTSILTGDIQCFDFASFIAQNNSVESIANTIPVIAAVFDACNYVDLFAQFQAYGARAIVVATHIDDSTDAPTHAPSKAPFISPLNYNYWLPLTCTIHVNPDHVAFASFMNITDNIGVFMMDSLQTNFDKIMYKNVAADTFTYSFEANTTISSLSIHAIDKVVSNLLTVYLKLPFSIHGIRRVSCNHAPQYNESYSNAPTPEPTNTPTLNPTERSSIYDDIHIPIEEVSLSAAEELVLAIQTASDTMQISFSCETSSPTQFPSVPPTVSIQEKNETVEETGDDAQLVIFGYQTGASASVALTFPELDFLTFHNVYTTSCDWELDVVTSTPYALYLVSIDTIYTSVDELCIRFNNQNIVLKADKDNFESNSDGVYEWTATETSVAGANCSDSKYRTSIVGLDRGSYCFAAYQFKDDADTYIFRLQKRFKWTTPYVHIKHTNFTNNICSDGNGGALAIVSEDGIDECVSIKISHTNFIDNYALLGGGAIYRQYSFAELESYKSLFMSVLSLEYVNIANSMVRIGDGEGGSIKTDLASSQKATGLYFKYVLSITDSIIGRSTTAANETAVNILLRNINRRRLVSAGSSKDGKGGVLHFKYGNTFIANSTVELGKAYRGGGIYLYDTVFQLSHTKILGNTATGDGGGIYQALYTEYSSYDLCVSIYESIFADNTADGLGGAIYSALHGKDNVNRQSCFKIINGTFLVNGNVSVYVNVTSGAHKVLRNQGALYTFCPDTDECKDFRTVLAHLCVAEFPSDCTTGWEPYDPNPLELVRDIPGASVVLYVYGWDAFGHKMLNTEYGITASAMGAQVINPHGTASTSEDHQYIVPLVVATGSKDQEAEIIVEDTKGGADPILIQLQITDCEPGYHQKQVGDSDLFTCDRCEVGEYTMGTSPCRKCPDGLTCVGGNVVYVKENWYAKVGVGTCYDADNDFNDENYDPDNSYISTTLCPPGYCCTTNTGWCDFPNRFDYTARDDLDDPNYSKCHNESNSTSARRRMIEVQSNNNTLDEDTEETDGDTILWVNDTKVLLCATNRDPSFPMCGRCLPGYYETLSSSGNCAKCYEEGKSNEWIIPIGGVVCFGLVFWFFRNGRQKDRDIPHPFMTYGSKTLLFFYQILTFLTFRSSVQVVKPLAEVLNFNLDISSDGSGTCLLKRVTSREKLWLNLMTPAIIAFDLLILLSVVTFYHKILKKRKTAENNKTIQRTIIEKKLFANISPYSADKWKNDYLAMEGAFWNIFMIVYVQITSAFIKLSICYPFGDKWYLWYAGDNRCTWDDAPLVFCNIFAAILIFAVPVLIYEIMRRYKKKDRDAYEQIFAPLILAYSKKCCYFSPFNVFRRAILIVLPSVPTKELSVRATASTFTMGCLILVHAYLTPFKWSVNNHLESFVLLCGFFIATLNITDNPPVWFPVTIAFLALIPLVPLPFLFWDYSASKSKTVLPEIQFEVVRDVDLEETGQPEPASTAGETEPLKAISEQPTTLISLDVPDPIEVIQSSGTAVSIEGETESDSDVETVGAVRPRPPGMIDQDAYHAVREAQDRRWTVNIPGRHSIVVIKRPRVRTSSNVDYDAKEDPEEEQKDIAEEQKQVIETKYGTKFEFSTRGTKWMNTAFAFRTIHTEFQTMMNVLPDHVRSPTVTKTTWFGNQPEPDLPDLDKDEIEMGVLKAITMEPLHFTRSMEPIVHSDSDSKSKEEEHLAIPIKATSIDTETDKHLDQFLADDAKQMSGIDEQTPELWQVQSITLEDHMQRSTSRFRKPKNIEYHVIILQQKGWHQECDEQNEEEEEKDMATPYTPIPQSCNADASPTTEMVDALYVLHTDANELQSIISGDENDDDDASNARHVPKEYAYIDGVYGCVRFDPEFESMIYCHHDYKWLQLKAVGVLNGKVTWSIKDTNKGSVFYEAKGESLLVPPLLGWKRLIDARVDVSDDSDLEMKIATKALDVFDAPIIVGLKPDKDQCVSIEYEYKKLTIADAPHIRQWIEVKAYKQQNKDAHVAMEIIELEHEDEKEDVIESKEEDVSHVTEESKQLSQLNESKLEAIVEDAGDELTFMTESNEDDDDNQGHEAIHTMDEDDDDDDDTMINLDDSDDVATALNDARGDGRTENVNDEIYEEAAQEPSHGELVKMLSGILLPQADLDPIKDEDTLKTATCCVTNLELEQKHIFKVSLWNTIRHSESDFSDCIIPKTKPDMGSIGEITSDPESHTLRIQPLYPEKAYHNTSMQPMHFFVKIRPWPGMDSFVMNDDEKYNYEEKDERIHITHRPVSIVDDYTAFEPLIVSDITLGTEYSVWIETENQIGSSGTYQNASKYIACRRPPKPVIRPINIDLDDCSMSIYFDAIGYDDHDCRAWFQLRLIDPTIDLDDPENKEETTYIPHKEMEPILATKYHKSPIRLEDLYVGHPYIIQILCINNQGITYSDSYEPIMFEKPPPAPVIKKSYALDSEVVLEYECLNYKFYTGFHPEYEITASPGHLSTVKTTQTAVRVGGLNNSWSYKVKVKARNTCGESDWSNTVLLTPLQKPGTPSDLKVVSGDGCISVFWFSMDDMCADHTDGHFVVISDPPTKTERTKNKRKIEFEALNNNQLYRFKVTAINANFDSESEWSERITPSANKDRTIYKQEKAQLIEEFLNLRRQKMEEMQQRKSELVHRRRDEDLQRIRQEQEEKERKKLEDKVKDKSSIRKGTVDSIKGKFEKKKSNEK